MQNGHVENRKVLFLDSGLHYLCFDCGVRFVPDSVFQSTWMLCSACHKWACMDGEEYDELFGGNTVITLIRIGNRNWVDINKGAEQ